MSRENLVPVDAGQLEDEWDAGDRRYLAAASMLELNAASASVEEVIATPEIVAA